MHFVSKAAQYVQHLSLGYLHRFNFLPEERERLRGKCLFSFSGARLALSSNFKLSGASDIVFDHYRNSPACAGVNRTRCADNQTNLSCGRSTAADGKYEVVTKLLEA